jgi:hypothetical protein
LYFPYIYSIEEASNIDAGMLFSLYQEKNKTKKNYRHAVEELSASGPIQPASWWQKKAKIAWQSNMDVPR